jgi:hypothetical protein
VPLPLCGEQGEADVDQLRREVALPRAALAQHRDIRRSAPRKSLLQGRRPPYWRDRYKVGGVDYYTRPKRIGVEWQQLRASAALLAEWIKIAWREGRLGWPRRNKNTPHYTRAANDLSSFLLYRAKLELDKFSGGQVPPKKGADPPPDDEGGGDEESPPDRGPMITLGIPPGFIQRDSVIPF